MVQIGDFFFKYRNFLFIFLYLALFIPSAPLFSDATFGSDYYLYPLIIGLLVTVSGQLIRGATIALAYIVRGGKDKKVYANTLVTNGIFAHCRNPLYVGNILMLVGVGILVNSLLFMVIFIPLFLFIYQAIVLAEERFLRNKFGSEFDAYTKRVHRWLINPIGLLQTISGMHFSWRRWLMREYNTQVVWLLCIVVILVFKYTHWQWDTATRNTWFIAAVLVLACYYGAIRYLKKSGKWKKV
ncbi:methyltransferase family protein [Parapedobacter sp. 10938]|uniref:methyltransferase family protein n=1 Tax=Parapedobacter flavus TaxID=3110225 RepID=UPI002DBBAEA8|nr:isoprenylcysteine carboxylmethyltransferase family protein [Parapedobacter sp. 10938]MEC3880394.1 isoprenylcysteine carboxylmethyltransferase family protein [Parapedobacter sp. 10938]